MSGYTAQQDREIIYLSKKDIIELGGGTSNLYIEAMTHALECHAKGEYVQPLKPYLRTQGTNGHIADRIIAMPAHVGNPGISGLKWVGSKHDNPSKRGLARASALVILNDPETNYPVAVMEGSLISGMRTAAVTVIAAKHLAKPNFRHISVLGCGVIARMQILSMLEQFEQIDQVSLFDLNLGMAEELKKDVVQLYPKLTVNVQANAKEAVQEGEIVITCTVTDHPYISFDWISSGTFISNISIMDVHKEVFLNADKVVVDDWDQSNREKKVIHQLVLEGKFSRDQLHAELGEIVIGQKPGREHENEIILLNPMGMAIEDIACAGEIYQRAIKKNIGTTLPL